MGIWRQPGVRDARMRISITVKIGAVFVLLSLVFGGVLLANSWLEEQLLGASAAVSYAGSQSLRVYKLAHLIALPSSDTSMTLKREMLSKEMQEFEQVQSGLKHGYARYGLLKETDPEILLWLGRIEAEWRKDIKPLLVSVIDALPAEASSSLQQYNLRVPGFASLWSDLLEVMEQKKAGRIRMLHRLQVVFLLIATALVVAAIMILQRVVLDPLNKLTQAAERIAGGTLQANIPLHTRDELGQLARTVEWMSDRIGQHIEHLEALRLTGQEITTIDAGGLEQVLRRIADRAADLVKSDLAVLLVRHPALECWVVEAASGSIFDAIRKEVLLFEETPFSMQAFERQVPVVVKDLSEHPDLRVRFRDQYGAKSYMAVPVVGPHGSLGVLVLLHTTAVRNFTDWEIRLAQQFASYAAVAIENVKLFEAAEAEARDLKEKLQAVERNVADLTHEVKGPAGRVAEFAAWLIKDYGGRLDERALRYLQWIQKEGKDLTDLAERTLDLAKLVHEPREVESVDVASVVQEVLDLHAGQCARKGIEVVVAESLPRFACRRIHLKQVLDNLIGNAIKFIGEQPRPHIEIGSKQDSQGVLLYVRDNGIGIEPAMVERIFQPFQRLRVVEAPGSGLGLSIVKTVVEHYHGAVTVTSEPGKGSTFYVRLPVLTDGQASEPPQTGRVNWSEKGARGSTLA